MSKRVEPDIVWWIRDEELTEEQRQELRDLQIEASTWGSRVEIIEKPGGLQIEVTSAKAREAHGG